MIYDTLQQRLELYRTQITTLYFTILSQDIPQILIELENFQNYISNMTDDIQHILDIGSSQDLLSITSDLIQWINTVQVIIPSHHIKHY